MNTNHDTAHNTPRTPRSPRHAPPFARVIDSNPTLLWFTTQLPASMSLEDRNEWHDALGEYMRTLGVVVHQQAGFSVAIPIGRDVLPSDRHELVNWAMDFADGVEVTISEPELADDLLDVCESVVLKARREQEGGLAGAGMLTVLQVVTSALLAWREEVKALVKSQANQQRGAH